MNHLMQKAFAGVIGAVATLVVQKSLDHTWTAVTGETPPNPLDPEVPVKVAVSWAIASAVGLSVTQLLVSRFAARRFAVTSTKPSN